MKAEKSSVTFHIAGNCGKVFEFFSPFPGELFFRKQRICDRILFLKTFFRKKRNFTTKKITVPITA
jgi:hypothetical protein